MLSSFKWFCPLLVVSTFSLGCSRSTDSDAVRRSPEPEPIHTIELSEPKAIIMYNSMAGNYTAWMWWKVEYRFLNGEPDPEVEYDLEPDYAYAGDYFYHGSELKLQGMLEGRKSFMTGVPLPESISFYVRLSGTNQQISNKVTCRVDEGILPEEQP